jgi:hypothetical protein
MKIPKSIAIAAMILCSHSVLSIQNSNVNQNKLICAPPVAVNTKP